MDFAAGPRILLALEILIIFVVCCFEIKLLIDLGIYKAHPLLLAAVHNHFNIKGLWHKDCIY